MLLEIYKFSLKLDRIHKKLLKRKVITLNEFKPTKQNAYNLHIL